MKYTALDTDIVRALQTGQPDSHGQSPEKTVSDGPGNPCRHCLRDIPPGSPMLVLAHRPFDTLHPYAESGPVFLCADPCGRHDAGHLPDILKSAPDYLLKGYGPTDRIVYGTGAVIAARSVPDYAATLFKNEKVAYIHVRSARNNCYQLRIDR